MEDTRSDIKAIIDRNHSKHETFLQVCLLSLLTLNCMLTSVKINSVHLLFSHSGRLNGEI